MISSHQNLAENKVGRIEVGVMDQSDGGMRFAKKIQKKITTTNRSSKKFQEIKVCIGFYLGCVSCSFQHLVFNKSLEISPGIFL
jgi:hypothetical protein